MVWMQVFEEQLKRIENELTTVEEELTCVSEERWLATKKVAWFRLKLFFQTVAQCLRCIYTLLTFAFVNLLNVLYVALTVSAELTRTLLETQGRQSVPHHNETENYRKTSTCFTWLSICVFCSFLMTSFKVLPKFDGLRYKKCVGTLQTIDSSCLTGPRTGAWPSNRQYKANCCFSLCTPLC